MCVIFFFQTDLVTETASMSNFSDFYGKINKKS